MPRFILIVKVVLFEVPADVIGRVWEVLLDDFVPSINVFILDDVVVELRGVGIFCFQLHFL